MPVVSVKSTSFSLVPGSFSNFHMFLWMFVDSLISPGVFWPRKILHSGQKPAQKSDQKPGQKPVQKSGQKLIKNLARNLAKFVSVTLTLH